MYRYIYMYVHTVYYESTDYRPWLINIFMIIGIVILELLLIIIISVLKLPFPIKYILSKTHYTSNLKVDFTFKSRDAITSE